MSNMENQEVGLFWKNEEERLRGMERRRKEQVDQARRVNNSSFQDLLSKSMDVDAYHLQKGFKDDLTDYHESERRKKEAMRQLYDEGMAAEAARQDKKRGDKQL